MRNQLKIKRWEAGMKQYELAGRLGCSASYLSMVENGRIQPTEEFKAKVAGVFQLAINILFPKNPSAKSNTGTLSGVVAEDLSPNDEVYPN